MEEQVEKFDPSKLMDGVKDRIKSTFVSLIPDAQWEQMCDTEMKKFFEPEPKYGYNNRIEGYNPSQFSQIVSELMKEKCKEYLKELLAKPEYSITQVWESSSHSMTGGKKTTLSDHLDNMVKEKMPEMMNAMFASVMADAFYTFFNNIQNRIQHHN